MSENHESNPQPNLPATVETPQFQPIAALGVSPDDLHRFVTNFPGRGLEAAAFITQALAKPGKTIDMMNGEVFLCRFYLAHVAEFVGDGGEVQPMPRMVLIDPDGQTLSFVSEGGIRSMDLIRSLCGDGPWSPPLPLSVVPVKTRRGFKTYRIILGGSTDASPETEVHGVGSESARDHNDAQRGNTSAGGSRAGKAR